VHVQVHTTTDVLASVIVLLHAQPRGESATADIAMHLTASELRALATAFAEAADALDYQPPTVVR
jgi:hypothetical protein